MKGWWTMRLLLAGFVLVLLHGVAFAESFTTNSFCCGISSNAGAQYIVGNAGSLNYREINSAASLTNSSGIIGNGAAGSNNTVLVTGTNSAWFSSDVTVGSSANANTLLIQSN